MNNSIQLNSDQQIYTNTNTINNNKNNIQVRLMKITHVAEHPSSVVSGLYDSLVDWSFQPSSANVVRVGASKWIW